MKIRMLNGCYGCWKAKDEFTVRKDVIGYLYIECRDASVHRHYLTDKDFHRIITITKLYDKHEVVI